MSKSTKILFRLGVAWIILSLIGCAGGNRGKLRRVQKPTESELHQDWNEYTVYYRRGLAFVYKIKNDRIIILNNSWIEISSEDMMAKIPMMGSASAWVNEILGQNDELFGYLIQRNHDRANVKIIDQNTVQLYYHYIRVGGGR